MYERLERSFLITVLPEQLPGSTGQALCQAGTDVEHLAMRVSSSHHSLPLKSRGQCSDSSL